MECPIARSVAQVGDAWRVLILRDALLGFRRFDEFETSLGIAPNILAKRLSGLVTDGLLSKRAYQQRPVRYEYAPTEKARDFLMVIAALVGWGTRWLSPKGVSVALVQRNSGAPIETVLMDVEHHRRCTVDELSIIAGPKAGPEIQKRSARLRARKEQSI
jgi:DNA-binding HxlR family transcriptional regulator